MKRLKLIAFLILTFVPINHLFAQGWSLDSCLQYTQENNKKLLAEAFNVQSTKQERKSVKSQLLPQIEARAGIDHYWKIPVQVFPGELVGQPAGTYVPVRLGTPWMSTYGLEANLKLLDVQQWQQIKLAILQEKTASSSYEAVKKQLLKNVHMAFYNVQIQQETNDIAQKSHENYQNVHLLIAAQYAKGLIDKIALNQSIRLLNDREDYQKKSAINLQLALVDLKFWMGFPQEDSLSICPITDLTTSQKTNFNEAFLPDYTLQKLTVEIAEQNWKSSRAIWFPSLHLTSTYERMAYGQKLNFINNARWFDIGSVGIQLRIPILAPEKTIYGPAKQKTLWKKAQLDFENYKQDKEKSFLHEKLRLEETLHAMEQQKKNLLLAEENESLAVQKIKKGFIDMIQLREVQEELYKSQEKLNELKLDLFEHQVELIYLQSGKQ
ncbi:MAG TPA: TolC family protein [Pseudosphingobacterium sp.]|nr:TolC family protein [Pseudosphingobacterium sp.]